MKRLIPVFLLAFCTSAFAAEVSGLRVWAGPDKTRAVLDLDASTEYSLFTLQNPDRVVIDLKGGRLDEAASLPSGASGAIRSVRHGKPDKDTLRVVLDLESESELKSFLLSPTGQYGHRLVVDLYDKNRAQVAEAVRTIASIQGGDRQIVVAIDAGHGGEDPGAIGKNRTREKDVVLQIAKRLKREIDALPGMRGVLIRTGDYYIPLRNRYEKARKHRADLFVSIHADAFKKRSVQGSSVFVLSQRGASSEFARLIAQGENAADLVGGVSLNDKDDLLTSVLLDLSQSATIQASNQVAADILKSIGRTTRVHKDHVGRANFMVLKSPDVPSVLVETAFISNPTEEKRLTQLEFQQNMAEAIARGIRNYFHRSPPPGTWLAANRDGTRHVVASGETLGAIASRYNITLNRLRQANNLSTDMIRVGAELVIPTG
ncbi:MAG: N-acetylmuramoyl-L-alanine amidase [Xanthomonadales bacterium]|nr:N-acetylmuramoyl-L-alanine amidase [Xanthomonadales bacterium]